MNNSFHYLRHSDENQYEDRPLVAGANACNHSSRNMKAKKNQLKYCTLPAAQSLIERGIVLETEVCWHLLVGFDGSEEWELQYDGLTGSDCIPAPSMAEVWRELPPHLDVHDAYLEFGKTVEGDNYAAYVKQSEDDFEIEIIVTRNVNPADALADLLIWVVEQKGKEMKP